MGGKDSKPVFVTYEEALERGTDGAIILTGVRSLNGDRSIMARIRLRIVVIV